jgi:hypothetical protein
MKKKNQECGCCFGELVTTFDPKKLIEIQKLKLGENIY